MAKKPSNNSENLLSKRMQKTTHKKERGRFEQQEEINIFVQNESQPTFDINMPYSAQNNDASQTSKNSFNNNFNNKFNTGNNNGNSNSNPLSQEEITFVADDNAYQKDSEFQFEEKYSNMYRKPQKNKPQKQTNETFNIGENALDGRHGDPFKREVPKKVKKIVLISIIVAILVIPQLVFRIPAALNISPSNQMLKVDSNNKQVVSDYIRVQNGTEDWDKDGITNATDNHPFNPDTDYNGIPDGGKAQTFINKGAVIGYENIKLEAKNQKVGLSKFLNYYVFSNHKGWVKISDEKGIPYIYKNNGWTEAKYSKEGKDYLVYIPCDCYIEFVPEDTKKVYRTDLFGDKAFGTEESRYVDNYGFFAPVNSFLLKLILPVTEPNNSSLCSTWYSDTYHIIKEKNVTKANALVPNTEHYDISKLKGYDFSYDYLYTLYKTIDTKETVLLSIITSDGSEATCFAYAYDYLGNIYVADAKTSKAVGVINIYPKSQTYCHNDEKFIREWYEFDGLGFSTKNGDSLIIY